MNKTLVTDTMCIIHTFHFTGKAVTAFTAWSHPTLGCDWITSENINTLKWYGLWTGNAEMKPNVLPKMFLEPLPLSQQRTHTSACSWGHRAALPRGPNHTFASAQKSCCSASGCLARFQCKQSDPVCYLYFYSSFNRVFYLHYFSALNYHFMSFHTVKITTIIHAKSIRQQYSKPH